MHLSLFWISDDFGKSVCFVKDYEVLFFQMNMAFDSCTPKR